MRLLKLEDPSMLAAARGRLASLRFRMEWAVLYAVGVALVLDSALIGLGWYALQSAAMGADFLLGKRYLSAQTAEQRRARGLLFVAACMVSILVYNAMAGGAAWFGGAYGALLGFVMAAGSLVNVMMFLFRAPVFLGATAAPGALVCLMVPFASLGPGPAGPIAGALGASLPVVAFLIFAARSAVNSGRMFAGLEAATRLARERQAEAEARQIEAEEVNSAKDEFLTTVTHELRTPLNAVIGYSEIIHEDLDAEGRVELAQDARRINAAARHLLGLIDQVLQLTKIESGRVHLELDEVDVGKLIEAALAAAAAQAEAAGNRVSARIAPEAGFARTDAQKLALCVGQLVSNAVKFTANGLIAVSADCERAEGIDWLRIAVSDTGAGMSAEQLEKAFQPFTQLDGSKTRAQGGMGLGLSIAARTAKLLRGEISAQSAPASGSTFTLRLPMRLNDDFTISSGAAETPGAAAMEAAA